MPADFLSELKISFNLCALQMYCFGTFADVECLMLTIVAYELYVAICNPLLYTVVMSRRFCAQLVVFVSLEALIYPAVFTYFTIQLSFCNSSVINHFFCNFLPTLALFSSDTTINEMVMFPYSSCVPGCSYHHRLPLLQPHHNNHP